MEQIQIIFFALTSFFGIEDGRIAADKTTVTIYPKTQKIEIIQENLFTVIQSEKDTILILDQWNKLRSWKERKTSWAKDLDSLLVKNLTFTTVNKTTQSHLVLTYLKEKDLQKMGIWYNAEKNQFSINHIPQHNIKTNSGRLEDNYWIFDGYSKFSFTVEPFLQMPEKYKKLKIPINKVLMDSKTED